MIDDSLDPHAILQTLGLTEVKAVIPVQGGTDTAVWRVEQAENVYTLRIFRAGEDHACERERTVMQGALAAGLPVAQVHATGTWHNHPALLLSWIPGWPVAEEVRLHPWRAWPLGELFGHTQAMIHARSAREIFQDQLDGWIAWLGSSEQDLQQLLRTSEHRRDALLHLDYHPWNVLTDGASITGILDWRNALAGDPRADAARTLSILRIGLTGELSTREKATWRAFQQGWRSGYTQTGGSLKHMSRFYAWAGAITELDLASKRGPEDLAHIHQWTARWKARAIRPQTEDASIPKE